jgi:hypothetical protein
MLDDNDDNDAASILHCIATGSFRIPQPVGGVCPEQCIFTLEAGVYKHVCAHS